MRWIIILVIIFGLIAWGGLLEENAESSAIKFCESVALGGLFSEITEKISSVGEDRLRIIQQDLIVVGFTGIPPFSRHLCEISLGGDGVRAKRYIYLD